ncbi:MAG: PAS domain S-box protein [Candidatus Kuenenia sp.]|nr:PAS domain S-box protein [Candidatus Kuenenia hertensis]
MSIKAKLTTFMALLILIVSAICCTIFYLHDRKEHSEQLVKFGSSLASLLAQDNDVKLAITANQPAFLEAPIRNINSYDIDKEVAYWKVMNRNSIIKEGQISFLEFQVQNIPCRIDDSETEGIKIKVINLPDSSDTFYDISLPVREKRMLTEEEFAAQVFGEEYSKTIIGFVQIGLSTHVLNEKLNNSFLSVIIPVGLCILFGGFCIVFFLNKYFVRPIKNITDVSLEIAGGNLSRRIKIYSDDEIGILTKNFNQMTLSLERSYAELKTEILKHKHTSEMLRYRLDVEEIVASISTQFINYAPESIDMVIDRSLKIIGEFAGVDRCNIFQFYSNGAMIENTHEWCADGIQRQIDNLKNLPSTAFNWWMEQLNRHEVIHVPNVADLPDSASAEKEILQAQDIQSLVVVPLVYHNTLMGFIGFDLVARKKEWSNQDVMLLKTVGEILTNAIEHKRKEDMLQQAYDELDNKVKERTFDLLNINRQLEQEIEERKRAEESLKKYEILFSEIHDLPYICDDKGNILFVNKSFERLTGHKPEEFMGKSFAPLFDEENLKLANEVFTKTLRGESPNFELYFKDTGVLCEYKNLPLKDEEGNIIGVIGTARDVTERKNMINALEQAKNFAENLIETANVMVLGLRMDGTIHIINKAAEELTGYTKKELIGKNFFDVLVPKGRYHYFWDNFQRWRQGKGILLKVIENPIVTKTGLERYISWQNSEIIEHGVAIGSISFGIDITDQKLMNTLVERMRLTSIIKDISMIFNQSIQLPEKLKKCTETIITNLDADCSGLWMLNETDNVLELRSLSGNLIGIESKYDRIPFGKTDIGLIAKNTLPYITNNFIDALRIRSKELEDKKEIISFAGFPLAIEGKVFGVVALFTKRELNNFVVRAMASVTDIVSLGIDREKNVEALRISEYKYRMLLENLPQKVFHKDRNSVYVSCNENYARDIGITSENIKGKTDYEFFPNELAEKYRRDDRRIMNSGIPEELEEKYVVEGKEYVIQTVKTPIRDEKGEITGILGIFWDITEKIHFQMEVARSRHMASLGELAAGVAHEINNPINGIINYAQILANKNNKQSKEYEIAKRIKKESIRIANIVKSLLSFARPGESHNVKKLVHVYEILFDTFTLIEAQMHKEGIKIKLNLPKTLPEVLVNAQQIQQVFLNVISNARYALNEKYKAGHENKIIEITGENIVENNVRFAKIAFVDYGIGIPSDMLEKIMDPFFTLKPKGVGTGLGLSICHKIITEHGGKFTIESVKGKFTKAIIMLPAVL